MASNDFWLHINNNDSSMPYGTPDDEQKASQTSSKNLNNIFDQSNSDQERCMIKKQIQENGISSVFGQTYMESQLQENLPINKNGNPIIPKGVLMFGKTFSADDFQSKRVLTDEEAQEIVISTISHDAEIARTMLMQQNNGFVSNLYNKYKEWKDDDLSLTNVEEAVVLQQECADNLQKAKDGTLSKREYFLQNREHLKTMMKRRLFRKDENTGLDFLDRNRGNLSKEEFEKLMEDYINSEIEKIDKLDSLKNIQHKLILMSDAEIEHLLDGYHKNAQEYAAIKNNNNKPSDMNGYKGLSPIDAPSQGIPKEYDTIEPMTFEEVFKLERNQEYSKEKIENYERQEDKRQYVIDKYIEYQQCATILDNYYNEYYGEYFEDINNFKQLYNETLSDLTEELFNNEEPEGKIKVISNEIQSKMNSAFGDNYVTNLVKAMQQDNQTIIDRTTGVTQVTGLGMTVVGGVLCFTPAAAVGAGLVTLGNTLSIGGLAAENVLGYTEALTRQHIESEEIEELNNSLFMDAGGFLIGAAAGKVGMKAFNKLIDVKLAEVFKVQTFKGNRAEALKQVFTNPEYLKNFMQAAGVKISADFLISYAGDLAMSEVLGTDDDWMSLLKANLIGVAASTSGDVSSIARIGIKGEKYRELKQQVQNRSQEYRESLNQFFAETNTNYKKPIDKYQQVIEKAVKCYEEYGVKVEFEDVQGEYGEAVFEIYKELNNFSKINGLDIPNKIVLKKGKETEVYWDKNTNEVTYVIGDEIKANDVRYSLRHEFVHGNDTKPELGDNFPESFKIENLCEYIKEMLKAGLTPDEITYAFQNRKEFIAIASQGDVSKYDKIKSLLVDCGMPKEVLEMPLADIHSRDNNYLSEELDKITQETIAQINNNGGVGYKHSGDRLYARPSYKQGNSIRRFGSDPSMGMSSEQKTNIQNPKDIVFRIKTRKQINDSYTDSNGTKFFKWEFKDGDTKIQYWGDSNGKMNTLIKVERFNDDGSGLVVNFPNNGQYSWDTSLSKNVDLFSRNEGETISEADAAEFLCKDFANAATGFCQYDKGSRYDEGAESTGLKYLYTVIEEIDGVPTNSHMELKTFDDYSYCGDARFFASKPSYNNDTNVLTVNLNIFCPESPLHK